MGDLPSSNQFKTGLLLWIVLSTPHSFLFSATLPEGFEESVIVKGVNAGTAISILPDGRVIYVEQTGFLRMVIDEELLPEPVLDISESVDAYWERGLIGLTYDPDFPLSPYLYLVYVAKEPYTHHVVSRFTLEGNRVDPASERILLKGDDQSKIAGRVPAGHQGGPIRFGLDGKLYIANGEHLNGEASQSLTTIQGKILRINRDGSIPKDNPFYGQTHGKYRSIYAIGIRNPWGMDFMPGSNRLFESDVGQSTYEEINEIISGYNYGWPAAEGPSEKYEYTNPVHHYPTTVGRCIAGGVFYPQDGNYPEPWKGKFFFVDWASNWVKAIDVNAPGEVLDFASDLNKPVWNEVHPDGSMWVMNRGTIWRDGNKFQEDSGSLVVFRYTGESSQEPPELYAEKLSDLGIFSDLTKQTLQDGFVEAKMNAPPWLPGLKVKTYFKLPEGSRIQSSFSDEWIMPERTVIVQHYSTVGGLPHETHVFRALPDGKYQAVAYRWSKETDDAFLVRRGEMVSLPDDSGIQYYSPGPEKLLNPQQSFLGYLPKINMRQFNVGTQISEWSSMELLDIWIREKDLNGFGRLASLDDPDASLELKVRSYLDVNCTNCHQPGGPSRGKFDARFETPLERKNLINGELMAGDLRIEGAKIVVPGDPDRSILLQRMKHKGPFKMPPVSVHNVESPAIEVIEEWIRGLEDN